MGEPKRRVACVVGLVLAALTAVAAEPAGATTGARPGDRAASVAAHPAYQRGPAMPAPRRLHEVMARVEAAEPWASVAGPAIAEYYVDKQRGVVRVGVERVTPALRKVARRTFGATVAVHQADRYYRTSRDDDPAPHAAGSVIQTDLGTCTSGFGVSRGGTTYFLGTAHCFRATGETVTNGTRPYGRVVERELAERGPDAALVRSDFGPRMYVGGPRSDLSRAVTGTRTPPYGTQVCASGASTGQTCAGVRRQSEICVRFGDGITTCHLTRVISVDGTPLVRPGDSGGPLYVAGASAVGMAVGGNQGGTELLYHPVDYLLDLWNARLLVAGQPR